MQAREPLHFAVKLGRECQMPHAAQRLRPASVVVGRQKVGMSL